MTLRGRMRARRWMGGKNINMKCSSIQMLNLVTNGRQMHAGKMPAKDPLVHTKLCKGVMAVG